MDLEDCKKFSISTLNYGYLLFIHKIIHILLCSILPSYFIRLIPNSKESKIQIHRYIPNQQLQTNQPIKLTSSLTK